MGFQTVFKRYEKKYIISSAQRDELLKMVFQFITPDEYGRSEICNIYYDTPDFCLIRNSIEKPVYKEKLRLRTYGTPKRDSTAFVELKKKYKGVVYKRRMPLEYQNAISFIERKGFEPKDTQVKREIEYFLSCYPNLKPASAVFYQREAFYSKTDRELRLTFDDNLLFSDTEPDLLPGPHGKRILEDGKVVLEIKCIGAMPLWLVHALSVLNIYPSSFSKYGTAYKENFLFSV